MQASDAVAWHSATSPFDNVERFHLKSRNSTDGTLYAEGRSRGSKLGKRSLNMGDAAYIIGVIGFFVLCALYVAALDRM